MLRIHKLIHYLNILLQLVFCPCIVAVFTLGIVVLMSFQIFAWLIWLLIGLILILFQSIFSIYHGCRIFIDLILLATVKIYIHIEKTFVFIFSTNENAKMNKKLRAATTYEEWMAAFRNLENLRQKEHKGNEQWSNETTLNLIDTTIYTLRKCRLESNYLELMFILPGIVKRNHLGIESYEFHSNFSSSETERIITDFNTEVVACFDLIMNADDGTTHSSKQNKLKFFASLAKSLGQSALCLSGGGSLAMYHMVRFTIIIIITIIIIFITVIIII